jgi:hypothetical protein
MKSSLVVLIILNLTSCYSRSHNLSKAERDLNVWMALSSVFTTLKDSNVEKNPFDDPNYDPRDSNH